MATARRIFISYARRDGAAIAQSLRHTLEKAHHKVFLDNTHITGGCSWSKEIEAALDNCHVLVAILTPASFSSEICRAEQIWALDNGKLVIPVLASPDAKVPVHLKSFNRRRYPEQEADLLKDLGTKPKKHLVPRALRYDTIPNLPQNHIHRESALAALRNLVFTESANGNIAVTAMAGMGGIGKTVLATALCRDIAVQRAFPDGIAWVTIGHQYDGNFIAQMHQVARALGDDPSGWDSPLTCESRYRTLLHEKAALVVVDDVWSLEHLKPLLVDAPHSRFLFTTREAHLADFIAGRRYSANLLQESEARDLLSRWSEANPLPPVASEIIHQCGNLAAAIAQIGALLRNATPVEWRDTLNALRLADIAAIEERLPRGQPSFFKSLAVSLQALPEEMQARYRRLAVLLEDGYAPLVILQTLWAVDDAEGRRTARYFVDRSLVSWENPADPDHGIRLHDLQLDYLRAHFADRSALALIHEAWRMSAHVLERHPAEFCSQLMGRLLPHRSVNAISEFIGQLRQSAPPQWLMPLWPALDPPGTSLIRTVIGHSGPVRGLATTADGKFAVSASSDRTLKLWDLETGQVQRTLFGHASCVNAVAITVDGKYLVSACNDNTLKVWDLECGHPLRTLVGHSGHVVSIALSADGKLSISASWDRTLKVWEVETGNELRTLQGHTNLVTAVALSADGKRALSASADRTLKLWDVTAGRELRSLTGHSDCVRAVALSRDGKRAVSASSDTTLKVWDVETGQVLHTLSGHSKCVRGVALTPDGKHALSASHDNTLKLWDVESGRELQTLTGHSEYVTAVAFTDNGRRALSASEDKTLKLWNIERRRQEPGPAGHAGPISGIALTADRRRALSPSHDRTLKIWDLATGLELSNFASHVGYVSGIALAEDGKVAVSASSDTLKVWDVETGGKLLTLAGHVGFVTGVALTPDGERAVSGSYDKTLRVWDVKSGCELHTLTGHSEFVTGVALAANGKRALSASADKTVKVWDVENGREYRTLAGHSDSVTAIALTPDGKLAVSASADKTLRIWDVETGLDRGTLHGHSDRVNGVALTPDGRRAASASLDATLKVWDVAAGACLATFHCDGAARCCAFVDDHLILAGDAGGRLYLLSLETPAQT